SSIFPMRSSRTGSIRKPEALEKASFLRAAAMRSPSQRDHLLAAAAQTALQLRQLSPDAQTNLNDAILSGTRPVELRTRLDGGIVEPVLVPEPLRLTRMAARRCRMKRLH